MHSSGIFQFGYMVDGVGALALPILCVSSVHVRVSNSVAGYKCACKYLPTTSSNRYIEFDLGASLHTQDTCLACT